MFPTKQITLSTLDIAEAVGKPHSEVYRDTEKILTELGRFSRPVLVGNSKCFVVSKKDAMNIAAGYSAIVRDRLLTYIEELEQQLRPKTLQHTYIQRLENNYMQVPAGYFSVLTEVFSVFHEHKVRLEHLNQDKHPDVSAGQMFARHLKDNNIDTQYIMYPHNTGRTIQNVRAYPEAFLPLFRRFLREHWFDSKGKNFIDQTKLLEHK